MYFDELLGPVHTQKLVEIFLLVIFGLFSFNTEYILFIFDIQSCGFFQSSGFYFLGVCCNIRSFSFPFIRSSGLNPDVRRPLFLKAPPLAV